MYEIFDQLLGKNGDEQMQILLDRMKARKSVKETQKERKKTGAQKGQKDER